METRPVTVAFMAKTRGPYTKAGKPPTKLHQFMESRGMTQADVKKRTGLSTGRINAAVQGKKTTPATLIALSKGLQAPPVALTDDIRLIIKIAAQTVPDQDARSLAETASFFIAKSFQTPRK